MWPEWHGAFACRKKELPRCTLKVLLKLCCSDHREQSSQQQLKKKGKKKKKLPVISIKFKLMSGDTEDRGGSSLLITLMGCKKKKIALLLPTAL